MTTVIVTIATMMRKIAPRPPPIAEPRTTFRGDSTIGFVDDNSIVCVCVCVCVGGGGGGLCQLVCVSDSYFILLYRA